MCLITEHAHALEKVKELEAKVSQLNNQMSRVPKPADYADLYYTWVQAQVGVIPLFGITYQDMKNELADLGLGCMIDTFPDTTVYHTDEVTLAKLVPYLTYPADYFVINLDIDCDDYSRWASSDASKLFKVNGVCQCWGDMPLGYHAWSMSRVGEKHYMLWDPNAGFEWAGSLFEFGKHGYQPRKWK